MTKGKTGHTLKSSVEESGEFVDKIIQFASGNKKTFRDVVTSSIVQSEFTRFILKNGVTVYINTKNVDWFEVHNK